MEIKTEEDIDTFISSIEHKYTPKQLARIRWGQEVRLRIHNRRSAPLNNEDWTILDTANLVKMAQHLYEPGAGRWVELLYDYNKFYLCRYLKKNKTKLPQYVIDTYNELIILHKDNRRMLVQ